MAQFSELAFDNRLAQTGIRTCQVYLIIMYRSLIYLALLGALNSTPCSLRMQIQSTLITRHVFLILLFFATLTVLEHPTGLVYLVAQISQVCLVCHLVYQTS